MARLSKESWDELKEKYETTSADKVTLTDLSKEFGVTISAITNMAQRKNWQPRNSKVAIRRIDRITQQTRDIVNDVLDKQLQQTTQIITNTIHEREVIELARLVQFNMLETIQQSIMQVRRMIIENPSGLYKKSENEKGQQFGRVTETIRDLAPSLAELNKILGVGRIDTAIQVNNTASEPLQIFVNGVEVENTSTNEINQDI